MHNHFSDWFNYKATLKILVFSMLAGAALPAMFALGIRLQAVGSPGVGADGDTQQSKPLFVALAWLIYAVVVVVIIFSLLYIARDFIAHQLDTPFLGALPKS